MPASELTKCPKCGRMVPPTKCACGYQIGFIRWNRGTLELALKQGWRVLKCPPSKAFPAGIGVLVHPDRDCEHAECPYYPRRHRHRASDVNEIVLIDDVPGGVTQA
jgi:hypothetical protein